MIDARRGGSDYRQDPLPRQPAHIGRHHRHGAISSARSQLDREPINPSARITGSGGNPALASIVYVSGIQDVKREVPTMADRTLRGSRLGAISYETEYGAEPAPRNVAAYRCAREHEFQVPFSEEAEIPTTWERRIDGTNGLLVDGPEPEAKQVQPPRTHWYMLMERRTIAD